MAGVGVPYADAEVLTSSCYVMPIVVRDAEARDPVRQIMQERFGVQTSVLYPSIAGFTEYADSQTEPLPRSELAARTELTLPLFPHMTEEQRRTAVEALTQALEEAGGRGS